MRLPVVCSCKVREIDDEWRDSVDRGSRRLVLSLPDAGVGDEFLIYQCVDRFDCVSMVEEVHTHRYSACSVQGDVCNLKTNLGTLRQATSASSPAVSSEHLKCCYGAAY